MGYKLLEGAALMEMIFVVLCSSVQKFFLITVASTTASDPPQFIKTFREREKNFTGE
jgi:hypothetical protein